MVVYAFVAKNFVVFVKFRDETDTDKQISMNDPHTFPGFGKKEEGSQFTCGLRLPQD